MKKKIHPYVAPVPIKDIESLSSETITKKSYDKILAQIGERFDYIFNTLMDLQGRKVEWYAFSNVSEEEGDAGEFDPVEYEEEIEFTGQFKTPEGCLYEYYLPTRWLSEDFEEALRVELAQHKKTQSVKKKLAAASSKKHTQRKKELLASIRSKLTKEELDCIQLK